MDVHDRPVGYTWIIKQFSLTTLPLSHASYIGAQARCDTSKPGGGHEVFQATYWPGDDPFEHLVFASSTMLSIWTFSLRRSQGLAPTVS